MAASVFESALFGDLFPSGPVGRLFTDAAEVRAMLLVEGMLAEVQGSRGIIPADSAAAIKRASLEVQIDPGSLRRSAGQNGVPVPGLVAEFRNQMQAPEHAQFVHWGATSQDIIDTALMLRLRQALTLIEADIRASLQSLAKLAETHAETAMPARTFGQHATPTSFGAVVGDWGWPLIDLLQELPQLRLACLQVSLSGAAGTSSALGDDPAGLRQALAAALGLNDPGRGWHTDRSPVLRLSGWLVRLCLGYGKIGEDVTQMTQTGIAELSISGAGASSTMPQKQNPVLPAAITALARHATGLEGTLKSSATPRHQRDGAAWFTEWLCLPQIVLSAASTCLMSSDLFLRVTPSENHMTNAVESGLGTLHAEALSFALCDHMPRPAAQAVVKSLCQRAAAEATPLKDLVSREYPQVDAARLFDPKHQMGLAPQNARNFADRVRSLQAVEDT